MEETTIVKPDPFNDGEHWRLVALFKARGLEVRDVMPVEGVVGQTPTVKQLEVVASKEKIRDILLSDNEFRNRVNELLV